MRVHFVAVAEPNDIYINMLKLLLFSFRKNAGEFKDAPFTVVFNGHSVSESDRVTLQNYFNVNVRIMPRLGNNGTFINKFNAFYAVDETNYDVLVFFDCDLAILGPLDNITQGLCSLKTGFIAMQSGKINIKNYRNLIIQYANLSVEEVESQHRESDFPTQYPHFNAGVLILTRETVLIIRDDCIRFCNSLNSYGDSELRDCLRYYYNRLIEKTTGRIEMCWGVHYPLWCTDQLGLALSILKHRIPYQLLSPIFNWTGQKQLPDKTTPHILHYMKGLYNNIAHRFFKEDCLPLLAQFAQSSVPGERALSRIISCYLSEAQRMK